MNISLSTIAAAIVATPAAIEHAAEVVQVVLTAAENVVTSVAKLVSYIPTYMQTFEDAYAAIGDGENGAGKLAGVLAALEGVAAKIAADWNDTIKSLIANIIAQAKSAYNAVVGTTAAA